MKKAGKVLFSSLGELRDVQVMMEWVQRLGPPGDFETQALLDLLARREQSHKITASESLRAFDLRQWRKWSRELPHRANRLKPGSVVFKHLALERWSEAYELHRRAMRNRSQTALHQLRIGIKRFRYIVENFLLYHHEAWSSDLKELQDLLGDIHDLDVLWTTAVRVNAFGSGESRERWHATIVQARQKRLDRYRERMVGPESLWKVWRADLPQAHQIRTAASMRLELWASLLDPNFSHSQQVAALAARIYDGLAKVELVPASSNQDLRSILRTASLMHDVGRFRHEKGHHKTSDRLIRRLKPPLGYSASELHLAAAIARFHRGALPQSQHKALREFPADQKKLVLQLAGILRFADVLDREQEGRVQNIQVEKKDGTVAISVQGYTPWRRAAQEIVGATHLLQLALGHAVRLKPLRPPRPQPTNSRPTRQTPSARPRRTESTIRT
jgi:hypothetical protein